MGWEGEAHGFPVESSLVVTLQKRAGLIRSVRVNGGGVQVLSTSHSSRWLGFFALGFFFLLLILFFLRERKRDLNQVKENLKS